MGSGGGGGDGGRVLSLVRLSRGSKEGTAWKGNKGNETDGKKKIKKEWESLREGNL